MTQYYEKAGLLDMADPLARFRDRFVRPDDNFIYMDGNSLGMLPEEAASTVKKVVTQ